MDNNNELTPNQMAALIAYEDAVAAGHAPRGSSLSEIRSKGSAVRMAAETLQNNEKGLSFDGARFRINAALDKTESELVTEEKEPNLYEQSAHESTKAELRRSRAQIKRLMTELTDARQLREHAFDLAPQRISGVSWEAVPRASSGKRETPVLFTSDFQAGEVIRVEETRGENAYNLELFRQRYRTMIGVTIKLVKEHHGDSDHIVYLRGGDAISGGIHDELKDTDDVPPPEQCIAVIQEETRGIEHLADAFGQVTVVSVAGNHDRITHKPRAKEYIKHSYDLLIQYGIEAQFKNDSRVKFVTDESGDVLFTVGGYRMLLTHGDRMGTGGGQGFLGTPGPVVRGAKKVKHSYAAEGHVIDLVLCGHYHTPIHVHDLVMCNGSLAGHSEYARAKLRAEPHPPTQTLFFIHEDRGVTATRLIDVNGKPMRSKGAKKVL